MDILWLLAVMNGTLTTSTFSFWELSRAGKIFSNFRISFWSLKFSWVWSFMTVMWRRRCYPASSLAVTETLGSTVRHYQHSVKQWPVDTKALGFSIFLRNPSITRTISVKSGHKRLSLEILQQIKRDIFDIANHNISCNLTKRKYIIY